MTLFLFAEASRNSQVETLDQLLPSRSIPRNKPAPSATPAVAAPNNPDHSIDPCTGESSAALAQGLEIYSTLTGSTSGSGSPRSSYCVQGIDRHDMKSEGGHKLDLPIKGEGKRNGLPGESGDQRLARHTPTAAGQGRGVSKTSCHTHTHTYPVPAGVLPYLRHPPPYFSENDPASFACDLSTWWYYFILGWPLSFPM